MASLARDDRDREPGTGAPSDPGPPGPSPSDRELAEALASYVDRVAAGEELTPEEFAASFPSMGPELARELRPLVHLGRLLDAGLPPGHRLGDYRIVGEAGRGGMGVVYEAVQVSLDRRVALKVLPYDRVDAASIERLRREARLAARLQHPATVRVFDLALVDGLPFYAMELVEGETLRRFLDRHPATEDTGREALRRLLDPRTRRREEGGRAGVFPLLARRFAQVAEALHEAHEQGIVHRDLEPSNLIADRAGSVRVLDFGLASAPVREASGEAHRGDGRLACGGTPAYMSPEQALGDEARIGPRTDVYGLGATLYEVLTGRPPVDGRTEAQVRRRVLRSDPRPIPDAAGVAPRDLATIVQKCLRKEPDERYGTAEALAQDLHRFARGLPVEARSRGRVGRVMARLGRHRRHRRRVVEAAVLGLLVAVTAYALHHRLETRATRRADRYGHLVREAVAEIFSHALVWQTGSDDGFLVATGPVRGVGRGPPAFEMVRCARSPVTTPARSGPAELASPRRELARAGPEPFCPHGSRVGRRHRGGEPDASLLRARRLLRRAIEVWSERPEAHHYLAWCHVLAGRGADAARALDRAQARDPRYLSAIALGVFLSDSMPRLAPAAFERLDASPDPEARRHATRWIESLRCADRGEWGAASRILGELIGELIDRPPPTEGDERRRLPLLDLRLARGVALCRTGRFEEALAELAGARLDAPEGTAAAMLMGKVLVRLGHDDLGHRAFDECIRAASAERRADVRLAVAAGLRDLGRLEEAEACLAPLPASVRVLRERSAVLLGLGRQDEALRTARAALAIAPDDASARLLEGHALAASGRRAEAEARYELVQDDPGGDPEIRSEAALTLGVCREVRGETRGAGDAYREALRADPKSARACYHLARHHDASGNREQASALYARAVELDPAHADSWTNAGVLHHIEGRLPRAGEHYERALRVDPEHPLARYDLGCLQLERGDGAAARESFERAVAAGFRPPELCLRLGSALEEQGETQRALTLFREALGAGREDARARLASALSALGRHDEAITEYEELLARGDEDPDSRLCLARTCIAAAGARIASGQRPVARKLLIAAHGHAARVAHAWPDRLEAYEIEAVVALEHGWPPPADDLLDLVPRIERARATVEANPALDRLLEHCRARLRPRFPSLRSVDAWVGPDADRGLVDQDGEWRFLTGEAVAEVGSGWREAAFDDGGWRRGERPFPLRAAGEEVAGPVDRLPEGRFLLLRRRFRVEDPVELEALRLEYRRDEGIAVQVFLNGGIACPVFLAKRAVADPPVQRALEGRVGWKVRHELSTRLIVPGENTMAIRVCGVGSADRFALPLLSLRARLSPKGRALRVRRAMDELRARPERSDRDEWHLRYLDAWLARLQRNPRRAAALLRALVADEPEAVEPRVLLARCLRDPGAGAADAADAALTAALSHPKLLTASAGWDLVTDVCWNERRLPACDLLGVLSPGRRRTGSGSSVRLERRLDLLGTLASGQVVGLDCGGEATWLDRRSSRWSEDRFARGGHRVRCPFEVDDVPDLVPPEVFRAARVFDDLELGGGYRVPLPLGRYRVSLWGVAVEEGGGASFGVTIGGRLVEGAFRVPPARGGRARVSRPVTCSVVVDRSPLAIDLEPLPNGGEPTVAAIRIEWDDVGVGPGGGRRGEAGGGAPASGSAARSPFPDPAPPDTLSGHATEGEGSEDPRNPVSTLPRPADPPRP